MLCCTCSPVEQYYVNCCTMLRNPWHYICVLVFTWVHGVVLVLRSGDMTGHYYIPRYPHIAESMQSRQFSLVKTFVGHTMYVCI